MLKLLAVLLTFYSCQSSSPVSVGADLVIPMDRRIILSASYRAAACKAQCTIHVFCQPRQMEITDMRLGILELHSSFLTSFPHRFKHMMDQLAQVPGITLLKEQ